MKNRKHYSENKTRTPQDKTNKSVVKSTKIHPQVQKLPHIAI